MEDISTNYRTNNHVGFRIEHIEQTLNSEADFGRRITLAVSRHGDLYIPSQRIHIPPVSNSSINNVAGNFLLETMSQETAFPSWINTVGNVLLKTVSQEIAFDMDKWQIVCISIGNRNIECPISFETIKLNDSYCTCSQCKYNFLKESIEIALKNKPNCPTCRAEWIDKTIYVNINVKNKNNIQSDEDENSNKNNTKIELISNELNNKIK